MYLSLICSQVEMQLEMYRWMNSGGRSTAVVNLKHRCHMTFQLDSNYTNSRCMSANCQEVVYLLTTSMECKDMSMLTRTEKYSVIWLEDMSFSSISMATSGLFSTRSGSLAGVRPMWYTSFGSFSNSANS